MSVKDSYQEFEATELFCSKCQKLVPVRKKMLLVLAEGDKYDYACSVCGQRVGGKMDPYRMRKIVEKTVKYRLERLEGVASVEIRGGLMREIEVNLDAQRLAAADVSSPQIIQALRRSNRNVAGGLVEESGSNIRVRTMGEFANLDQIRKVVVASRFQPATGTGVSI